MERLLFAQQDTAPVVYGGDISLEVGLAESLALLNWYQMTAAAQGVDWLAEQQEGGDNG